MESNLRLIVSAATTSGQINLSGFEQITLKKVISDIKDLNKRRGSFTQNFTIPGDENNNKILNHIFEIGADSTFDSRLKAKCWLLEDSIQVMEGILQLTNISIDDAKKVVYEVIIYGETTDIFAEIGEGYIEDLDYSDLAHTLSFSSVTNSWTANTDYFYGLIDYNYGLSYADITGQNSVTGLSLTKIYPAIRAKTIFDKIIDEAGYSYTSTFLTGASFSNWYIPYNGVPSETQPDSFAVSNSFRATAPSATTINYTATTNVITSGIPSFLAEYEVRIPTTNDSTGGNFDNGGHFDNVNFVYSATNYSIQRFTSVGSYEIFNRGVGANPGSGGNNPQVVGFRWYRSSYLGGTYHFYESYLSSIPQLSNIITQTPFLNGPIGSQYGPVQPGETVWCTFLYKAFIIKSNITGGTGNIVTFKPNAYIYNEVTTQLVPNMPVDMQPFIPKKIKKIDFVKSILTMTNSIIEPSPDNVKSLLIEPVNSYYSGGTTKNWTNKLDRGKKVNVQLISALQPKKTIFSYKDDKDFWNTYYKETVKRTYGDYIYDNDNDFNKEEKQISVIFSPTPCDNITGSDVIVVPKIIKLESNGSYGKTDSNIRILQKSMVDFSSEISGVTQFVLQGMSAGTSYPCLNHLSHPQTGTTDLNWGTNDYVYWTLNSITENNLVNTFWKKSLDEFNDKDAKIVTAYFDLTAADINQFRFNDQIYVKGLTNDGGHYFRVQSIEYSPTNPGSSKVELIKVIETTISASTRTIYKKQDYDLSTDRFSLVLGDSQNYGKNNLVIGPDNVASSERSFIIGSGNTIQSSTVGSFILGDNNTIVGGITGATIFGSGVSATTSDTVYTQNIVITSAVTFPGGVVISGNTLGLWSSSTGSNSIIANNGTSNIAGQYSFVAGQRNTGSTDHNFIGNGYNNQTTGSYCSILNGYSNIANTGSATILNGNLNLASASKSLVGNGYQNSATSAYSTIINGYQNIASNTYASIVGGQYNIASGNRSFIGAGGSNNAYGTDSVIAGGSNHLAGTRASVLGGSTNKASGSSSLVGNGSANSATTAYSSILNGVQNRASGTHASVIGGSGNTITGNFSTILGGQNINGTSANTAYMPAIAFETTGSTLAYREISIGDWDMDTTASKNVPHSLTSTQWYTVRGLSVMIWDDLYSKLDDLNGYAGDGGFGVDSTNIYLQRTAGGYFDSTDYNATSFNRGYISFWYNPNV